MRLFLLTLILSGCATAKIQVTASSPAQIDVDGITVCDSTPCEVPLKCRAPISGQLPNTLTATPKQKGLYVQTRTVNACEAQDGSKVNFEMNLVREAPVDRREITIK